MLVHIPGSSHPHYPFMKPNEAWYFWQMIYMSISCESSARNTMDILAGTFKVKYDNNRHAMSATSAACKYYVSYRQYTITGV